MGSLYFDAMGSNMYLGLVDSIESMKIECIVDAYMYHFIHPIEDLQLKMKTIYSSSRGFVVEDANHLFIHSRICS